MADVTDLVIDLTDELSRRTPPEVSASRAVTPDELAGIAAIHAHQLPRGFFVRFGPRFLAAYHRTFLTGPAATALAVGPVGDPRGFVVGTWDNPRHYRWLLRNVAPLARAASIALVARPGLAWELLRTRGGRYARSAIRLLRRRSRSTAPAASRDHREVQGPSPVVAVLTHVAVAAEAQGAGLGRRLVEAFVAEARERGADEVRLIAHVATPAPGFYRRLGWTSLGERTASDGTVVEEFQLVL